MVLLPELLGQELVRLEAVAHCKLARGEVERERQKQPRGVLDALDALDALVLFHEPPLFALRVKVRYARGEDLDAKLDAVLGAQGDRQRDARAQVPGVLFARRARLDEIPERRRDDTLDVGSKFGHRVRLGLVRLVKCERQQPGRPVVHLDHTLWVDLVLDEVKVRVLQALEPWVEVGPVEIRKHGGPQCHVVDGRPRLERLALVLKVGRKVLALVEDHRDEARVVFHDKVDRGHVRRGLVGSDHDLHERVGELVHWRRIVAQPRAEQEPQGAVCEGPHGG